MKVKPLLKKVNPKTLISDMLEAYGIEDVDKYLNTAVDCLYSWVKYPNMYDAIELLHNVLENNGKIGVLVDSDFDGILSAGIITLFLKELNYQSTPFFHSAKQHGLVEKDPAFQEILNAKLDLLIIPDAGSSQAKQCKILKDQGTEIIILDHHEITEENPYAIVVNHHLNDELNHALSGAGVTSKFVDAYCTIYKVPYFNCLDMVAVSIISDVCDLSNYENRAYLDFGLCVKEEDSDNFYFTNPLLELMFKKLGKGDTSPKSTSWNVAPKVNALCRGDNQEAKEIFFKALVGDLPPENGLKVARKAHKIQTETVKEIVENLKIDNNKKVIVAFIDSVNKNYTGLVANKLCGKYYKPCFVLRELNENQYCGSVRSPFDIASLINSTKLAQCDGHERACGIVLKKSNLPKLEQFFSELDIEIDPEINVTAILAPNQISVPLCRVCSKHSYLWGEGVPEPKFYIKGKVSKVEVFARKTNTIKFKINNTQFIKFWVKEEELEFFANNNNFQIEMIVSLTLNVWNGNTYPQAVIEDYEIVNEDINEDDDLF